MIFVTRHENSGGGGPMAKQAADHFTLDLLDKPKRGRPRKPDALTPAERARAYRARKRAAKAKREPMWRGPNGETWTGRGKPPKWVEQFRKGGLAIGFY